MLEGLWRRLNVAPGRGPAPELAARAAHELAARAGELAAAGRRTNVNTGWVGSGSGGAGNVGRGWTVGRWSDVDLAWGG